MCGALEEKWEDTFYMNVASLADMLPFSTYVHMYHCHSRSKCNEQPDYLSYADINSWESCYIHVNPICVREGWLLVYIFFYI